MDNFLKLVTSDFERIATITGFRFNQYIESVDWEYLGNCHTFITVILSYRYFKLFFCGLTCVEEFDVNDVVEKADVKSLSMLVASVLSYNIEKMSVSKKIFRLSQLIIDFLLHCKKHSTIKFNDKVCILCCLNFKNIYNNNYLGNVRPVGSILQSLTLQKLFCAGKLCSLYIYIQTNEITRCIEKNYLCRSIFISLITLTSNF